MQLFVVRWSEPASRCLVHTHEEMVNNFRAGNIGMLSEGKLLSDLPFSTHFWAYCMYLREAYIYIYTEYHIYLLHCRNFEMFYLQISILKKKILIKILKNTVPDVQGVGMSDNIGQSLLSADFSIIML